MGRATARAARDTPEALNAPLFRQLAERFDETQRHVVLDLGAASTPMLSLLGRSPSRVEIADLAAGAVIERLNAAAPGDELDALAESSLPGHDGSEPVDLVFCWDLPNYLAPRAASALMWAIAARARAGALAHALVVYAERGMPERPGRYVPGDDNRLVDRGVRAGEIAAPRYSPEAFGQLMHPFTVDRVRLLANGMQEYLLCLKP